MNKKLKILILTAVVFSGCTNLQKDYEKISGEINIYKTLAENYSVNKYWWHEYNDSQLDRLIETGLENNKDLIKSAININKALYQAKLVGTDLIPAFSGELNSNASKNIKNGDSSVVTHSGNLNISYEVDLWQRLADVKSSKEWEYKATIEDYESVKLALINNIINSYFSLMYLENYININKNIVKSYTDIEKIISNKLKYGTADILEMKEAEREILQSRNNLIEYEKQKKEQETLLRNLLNLKPDEKLEISYKNMSEIKNIGIDLNIPINIIAERPDVKAYEYRLKSMFKNAQASEKQLYPNITLSSSLSSENEKIKDTFETPIGFGSVGINLPFLNWNEIKWNVRTSRAEYEEAKENFQQGLTTALNEIDYNYFLYVKEKENHDNLMKVYEYDKNIAENYKNKYRYGKAELKDYIEALNKEYNSELSTVNSKYELIKNENAVYQSMGGKIYSN